MRQSQNILTAQLMNQWSEDYSCVENKEYALVVYSFYKFVKNIFIVLIIFLHPVFSFSPSHEEKDYQEQRTVNQNAGNLREIIVTLPLSLVDKDTSLGYNGY